MLTFISEVWSMIPWWGYLIVIVILPIIITVAVKGIKRLLFYVLLVGLLALAFLIYWYATGHTF